MKRAHLAFGLWLLAACEREPAPPVTTTFEVEGMTCDSCVKGITGTLTLVKGVESVEVDLYKETAVVVHDASKVSAADLEGRIDRMGYEATVRAPTADAKAEAKPQS